MSAAGFDSFNQNGRSERAAPGGAFSEELMRYFIKHCPNAAAIYDCNMVCLACSDRYLQDYGVSEEQVIGKNHYEVFPEMPQKWRNVHQRALRGFIEKNKTNLRGSTAPSATPVGSVVRGITQKVKSAV